MYIGNSPLYQSFPRDRFDGGEASYTLTYNPQTPGALLVVVDGVVQDPVNDYTTDGTTLTPTTPWPAGTDNVVVLYLGRSADIGTPSDDTVSTEKLQDGAVTHAKRTYNSGEVIQSVYAEYTGNDTIAAAIPRDDSIPQSGEGVELLTASITPKFTTSKIRIRFEGQYAAQNSSVGIVAALFKDSDADAIAARLEDSENSAGWTGIMRLEFQHAPGTISAITYKIRAGATAGNLWFNTIGNGTRVLGGSSRATLIVEEIAA